MLGVRTAYALPDFLLRKVVKQPRQTEWRQARSCGASFTRSHTPQRSGSTAMTTLPSPGDIGSVLDLDADAMGTSVLSRLIFEISCSNALLCSLQVQFIQFNVEENREK